MTPAPPDLSAFGAITPRRRLTGGHRNAVWLADGPQGALVAKSCRHDEAALRWLDPVHAAARAAGLFPPEPLTTPDGRLCAAGWMLEPFIAGRAATPAEARALAPRLDRLHAATAGIAQRPGLARATAPSPVAPPALPAPPPSPVAPPALTAALPPCPHRSPAASAISCHPPPVRSPRSTPISPPPT